MKELCLPEALGLDINQVLQVETGKRFEGGVKKLRLVEASSYLRLFGCQARDGRAE